MPIENFQKRIMHKNLGVAQKVFKFKNFTFLLNYMWSPYRNQKREKVTSIAESSIQEDLIKLGNYLLTLDEGTQITKASARSVIPSSRRFSMSMKHYVGKGVTHSEKEGYVFSSKEEVSQTLTKIRSMNPAEFRSKSEKEKYLRCITEYPGIDNIEGAKRIGIPPEEILVAIENGLERRVEIIRGRHGFDFSIENALDEIKRIESGSTGEVVYGGVIVRRDSKGLTIISAHTKVSYRERRIGEWEGI